jgi:hypothetical protein
MEGRRRKKKEKKKGTICSYPGVEPWPVGDRWSLASPEARTWIGTDYPIFLNFF